MALLPPFHFVPAYSSNDPNLVSTEIAFFIVAIPTLLAGIFMPKITGLFNKTDRSNFFVYFAHSMQISMFLGVSGLGVFAAILGSAWFIWLPMSLLGLIPLVLTFPTERRWVDWHHTTIESQQIKG